MTARLAPYMGECDCDVASKYVRVWFGKGISSGRGEGVNTREYPNPALGVGAKDEKYFRSQLKELATSIALHN